MVSHLYNAVAIVVKHRTALHTVHYSSALFSSQPAQRSKMKDKET